MRKVVKDESGSRILLDTEQDTRLWSGHSNIGPNQNRWLELFVHEYAGDTDKRQFYLVHRTLWEGERNYIQDISYEDAMEFVAEHIDDMSPVEETACQEYGLLDYTAFQ